MHFSNEATQSAMLFSDPDALISQYTRKMMAFLLFNPNPRRIVMIGLGGGSLAKFCYRHLSRSQITVVEIDEDVIAMRDEFCIPKDDDRFRVVHDDGARYVERLEEQIDVLLIDAFDADGIALSLANSDFYSSAARQLTENGMLVMNFWGSCERYVDNLAQARAAFGDSLLLVPVAGDANVLLFAFKQAPPQAITDELEAVAQRLQMRLLLDFPRYLRRICQGISLADPQTSAESQMQRRFACRGRGRVARISIRACLERLVGNGQISYPEFTMPHPMTPPLPPLSDRPMAARAWRVTRAFGGRLKSCNLMVRMFRSVRERNLHRRLSFGKIDL
jgi:spermidine synthase